MKYQHLNFDLKKKPLEPFLLSKCLFTLAESQIIRTIIIKFEDAKILNLLTFCPYYILSSNYSFIIKQYSIQGPKACSHRIIIDQSHFEFSFLLNKFKFGQSSIYYHAFGTPATLQ